MKKNYNSNQATNIIEKHAPAVYRLALSYTKNKSDAEDIMQEVFLRYIKKERLFQSDGHERAWFLRVTANCAKTHLLKRRATIDLDEISELAGEDLSYDGDSVLEAVMRLPERQRVCTHLFYYEDMPIREIAKALSMPESTVKSHLHRARNTLKESLKGVFFDE